MQVVTRYWDLAVPASLGLKARVKAVFEISFGLVVALLVVAPGSPVKIIKEVVVINNADAVTACVWCGVAFPCRRYGTLHWHRNLEPPIAGKRIASEYSHY
jgi:hypothetical protein